MQLPRRLITIFGIARRHISESVADPNSEYSKLLNGEAVTISDNASTRNIYGVGCDKIFTIRVNTYAYPETLTSNSTFIRVTVVYDGLYDVIFQKEEWELILTHLRHIIDRPV